MTRVGDDVVGVWRFETDRLAVGPWHEVADGLGIDLGRTVAGLLTARTTEGLPAAWQGGHSEEGVWAWINDRDGDASMMLVIDGATQEPVGLLVLAEAATPGTPFDRRIGYLLAERAWGRGLATELVTGLTEWARTQPGIRTLTGGVDPANRASARVLQKCGFELIDDPDADSLLYRRALSPPSEWDDYAAGWDADAAARAYAAAAFASLEHVVPGGRAALEGARVLDFGCGTGLLTERLAAAGSTVYSVDTSPAMLDVLEAKITQHRWTRVHTATSLPEGHEAFDLVVCSSVCAFLDDYPTTVAELVARLRDGGLFVQWDWERHGEESHGLTRTEIRDALTAAGLIEVAVSEAFSVTVDGQTLAPIMGHGRRSPDAARA